MVLPGFEAELLDALPTLRRYLLKLSRDPDQTDDLVQGVAAQAWRARDSYAGGSMAAWLCVIGRRLLISARRRDWRETEFEPGMFSVQTQASQPDRLIVQDALAFIASLNKYERAVIELVVLDGLKPAQAAVRLDIAVSTVHLRLKTARERLQTWFSEGRRDERPRGRTRSRPDEPDRQRDLAG